MATINPQKDLTAGIAGQSSDTITPDQVSFLAGHLPALWGRPETVLADQTLEALTVVGRDANGKIVPAVEAGEASPIQAIGVLAYAVDSTGADVVAEVYLSGNFNPDELVWPATYDTDAEKAAAFDGAPSPTQIVVTKTRTFAV